MPSETGSSVPGLDVSQNTVARFPAQPFSLYHDPAMISQSFDVDERIAGCKQQVGPFAGFDRPDFIPFVQTFRSIDRACLNRLEWSESCVA